MNLKIPASKHVLLIALFAVIFPVAALSVTHDVTVGDNFFSPSNLTIAPGDTVRWTNATGGNLHDVTSRTGAWTPSATASSFTFELTLTALVLSDISVRFILIR